MMSMSSSSAQTAWDHFLKIRNFSSQDITDLQQWQKDRGLLFLEQAEPMARTLRPHLVEPAQWQRDQAMTRAVVTALIRASECVEQDAALAHRYLGDWIERMGDLLHLDPGYPQRGVYARLDVLPTAAGSKVIEYNTTPGGMIPGDQLSELFMQLADSTGFNQDWQLKPLLVFPAVREALLKMYRAWGGTSDDPLFVLAVPRELAKFVMAGKSIVDALEASGLRACIADPGDLHFDNGALRCEGEPVGVLIRVFLSEMIPRLGDRLQGVLQAVQAGAVCMATAFRNTLLSHKALFALITDPNADLGLSAEVSELVRTHVPWTRLLLAEETTDPEGSRINLLSWAIEQREQLVCKPAAGYGGAGVVLGWTIDEAQWRENLEQAVGHGGYLLQQRADLTTDMHPMMSAGVPDEALYADQNIFVADGELAGYLTRLSPNPITNISQGASIVSSFVATPRS